MDFSSRASIMVQMATSTLRNSTNSIAINNAAVNANTNNLTLSTDSIPNDEVHLQPEPGLTLSHTAPDLTTNMPEIDTGTVYTSQLNSDHPIKMRLTKAKQKTYCISPVFSSESDVDDSDEDPNFNDNLSSTSESSDSLDQQNIPDEVQIEAEITNVEKKGRKRQRKPENWVEKKNKLLRNSGKAYVSASKTKRTVPEKKVRPGCGAKCRLGCSSKINATKREKIFTSYWNLADLHKQREYILRNTEQIKPKYRYSTTQDFRNLNSAFYFQVDETRIRVCKAFFKATLDINDRPIRTTLSKKSDTGILQDEMRGKHGKQPTVDPEIKESVRIFINNIPRIESHYLRAQTTREFIDCSKSIADLYRDYKDHRENQNLQFAHVSMFNRIFRGEYNLSFHVPKKDQCELCESFKNADDEGKNSLLVSYESHQKEKELSRKEKENDKTTLNGKHVAVYDLQAVMPLPRGQISSFYYKSKMNCYNFTISDLNVKNVECYFWDETEGKRGAVEIGSCVLKYIRMVSEDANNSELDIVFYSDNCCGQQKNKYLLSAYSYAVKNYTIRSITHKFLIRGHSQNEGDNVHSVIEKQIKRHLNSCPIYVPQQYATLIRTAKKNGPPYRVHEINYEDFYDLKTLQEEWGNNFTINTDRIQVKWNGIKILRVEKAEPLAFFYKTSYEDTIYKKVNVRNARKSKYSDAITFSVGLVPAYLAKIPLPVNKKKDIQDLIDKNIIPKNYFDSFFKTVLELEV